MEWIEPWLPFFGRLHPAIAHLPIGILILAVLMRALSWWSRYAHLREAAKFAMFWGAMSAVFAAAAGWNLAAEGGYDDFYLFWHRWLGVALAALAALDYISQTRWWIAKPGFNRFATPVLSAALLACLGAAGHLGGSLTHGPGYWIEPLPPAAKAWLGIEAAPPQTEIAVADLRAVRVYPEIAAPILARNCAGCHNPAKKQGGLDLTTHGALLAGGLSGPAVVPGDPNAGELIRRVILPPDHADFMPPEGKPPLPVEHIALLVWWVENGAETGMVADVESLPPDEAKILLSAIPGAAEKDIAAPKTDPAPPETLARLREEGFYIRPLAKGNPLLEVRPPDGAGNAELGALLEIRDHIAWLDLSRASIGDNGLEFIARMPNLARLDLSNTGITDAGIGDLTGLEHLESLNLHSTAIGKRALETAANLPALRSLHLWNTQAVPSDAEPLRAKRPELEITGFDLP